MLPMSTAPGWLRSWAPRLLLAGIMAALALAAGAAFDAKGALEGLLSAWLFWLGISMGSTALLMIDALTGSRWGAHARPILAPAAAVTPLVALLFVGFAVVSGGPEARNDGFLERGIVVLGIWSVLAVMFAQSKRPGPIAAGIGLVLYALTSSMAAVEWAQSLDPRSCSTALGAVFLVAQIASALAWASVALAGKRHSAPGLSGLLIAAILGVAYLGIMQLLVSWQGFALVTVGVGAVIPLIVLAPRRVRESALLMGAAGACVLAGLLLHTLWQVQPEFDFNPSWANAVAPVALGGVWLGLAFGVVERRLAAIPRSRRRD
jgi:hypothetical protein